MRNFFASIYESILYNGNYQLIYDSMFYDHGYIYIGLLFLLIPLAILSIFYFDRWFPYLKRWHWGVVVLIILIAVYGFKIGVFNSQILATNNPNLANALANPRSGYLEFAKSLRYQYGFINVILAFICSLCYSVIFKQVSKLHSNLPF